MSALREEQKLSKQVIIAQGTTTIGRGKSNLMVLPFRTVSMFHAQIITFNKTSHIMDLDSKNGIYVNGKKTHHHFLREGDSVHIGDYNFIVAGFEEN